jgi:hypothetical protein
MIARKTVTKRCGPIRLTLPISVAADLEKLERALANAAHAVEQGNVYSEWHGGFVQMRNFVIDPASLDVKEAAYTQ